MMKSSDRWGVTDDAVILIMPPELENEEAMLFFDPQMQMLSAPL